VGLSLMPRSQALRLAAPMIGLDYQD